MSVLDGVGYTSGSTMSDALVPNITPISIEQEMKSSFMDYAMSVIVAGAVAAARARQKPEQPRKQYTTPGRQNKIKPPVLQFVR
ncbi:MAG: hypothetical protein ACTHU0_16525, partial [Kofleriaceae bacterium]